MRNICNLIYYDFLLFARVLFNCLDPVLFNCGSRILFNCFAHVFFHTLICLIFVVSNHLTIFITPIFFILSKYTITINCNVCNVFEMYSSLFRICCMSFWFLMITINIISDVSVCGTYLLYLIIEYIHNLFHLIYGRIMCCARAFMCWM